MSKKPTKPQVPAKADADNTFGKNFVDGTIEAATGAGLIAGGVALVKAVTHHELSPSEIFLISILGPGVAHAITEGTMKFVNKFGADHTEESHGKLIPAGGRKVPAMVDGAKPKQLAAPDKLNLKGADHKQFHAANIAEGTDAMKAAVAEPSKLNVAAQKQHGKRNPGSPKHGGHH